jgi:polar amino acid transport system permease protein
MTDTQTRFKIVLPQMIRIALPSVSNEAIVLIKDTALITAIGLTDLLKVTKTIVNTTTNISAFAVAAVFYLVMSYVLTVVFKFLEKKFAF